MTTLPTQPPAVSRDGSSPLGGLDPAFCAAPMRYPVDPFANHRPTDAQAKNALIMIVDDETSVTLAFRKHLSTVGFRNFVLVDDATQAIHQMTATRPDLVLLDIRMQVNGLEILRTMRRQALLQDIPVIALTSDTDTETRIRALTDGADDFLTKPVNSSELVARVRNTLSRKIARDQLTKNSSELELNILSDPLTQVANRRAFDYEMKRRLNEWTRQCTPVSLLFLDIDLFRMVNDQHGQQFGDEVLCEIANEIDKGLSATDLVVRYAGDVFAIVLPGKDSGEAQSTAKHIRQRIESSPIKVGGKTIRLTVSLGVGTVQNLDSVESLVRRADQSLYEAKQNVGKRDRCQEDQKSDGNIPNHHPAPSHTGGGPSPASAEVNALAIANAKILVIDDEPSTVLMVRKVLTQAGYQHIQTLTEPEQAFEIVRLSPPDLLLCDIHMPIVTGLDILRRVRANEETKHIPVVFLTSSTEAEIKISCLDSGATDFLNKPVNASELVARVRNTLLAKAHLNQLANQSQQLEREIRQRTAELFASRREAIQCLACAAENRDDQTGHHVFRVGRYASIIAAELGFSPDRTAWMEHAAQLHDVGKIGIPDHILKKPSRLSREEFEIMKTHCVVGRKIILCETARNAADGEVLNVVDFASSDECNSPIMRMAAMVAETHHEKWDGSGYPCGLKGDAIPIEGRITAVADVFDATGSARHYKDAFSLDRCFEIIREGSGKHFDPAVVDAFFNCKQEITEVYLLFNDNARSQGTIASSPSDFIL